MLKRVLAGVAIAVMLIGAAVAGPFEDGLAAAQRGDYATAHRLWRPLAEQGDVIAQTLLGTMYGLGDGVRQDYAEASKWFGLAAEQGDAVAQYNLGIMYRLGEGVAQDFVMAHMWLSLAAAGMDLPRNFVLAHMWTNLAAAHGKDDGAGNRDLFAVITPDQIDEAERLAREWKPKPER